MTRAFASLPAVADRPVRPRPASRDAIGGMALDHDFGQIRVHPALRSPLRLARWSDPGSRAEATETLAEMRQGPRVARPQLPGGRAEFNGSSITITKGRLFQTCTALTDSSAPTPKGRFCVRRQGEAQRWGGWMGTVGRLGGFFSSTAVRQDRSSWYLLEPQFTTTRSKMDLHFGTRSEGCITVTNADCFQNLETVLNQPGTSPGTGYDGYPPGNAEGVQNPQHSVDCVAFLDVS